MSAINFTKLRNKMSDVGSVISAPPALKLPSPSLTQIQRPQKPVSKPKSPALKEDNKETFLVESRYCYGCMRFSVDRPDTPLEVGWCMRKDPEGGEAFFKINKKHKVSQCPLKKNVGKVQKVWKKGR